MDFLSESDLLSTQIELTDLSKPEIEESVLLSDTINQTTTTNPATMTSTMSQRGGFCVKEYEEQLANLQKENFNLKLRVYFLEKNSSHVPEDAESMARENMELKITRETLEKELHDKQEMLIQASKALDLLEESKNDQEHRLDEVISKMQEKIDALETENNVLQQALSETNDKTNLANDTGYADFFGAVDANRVSADRKLAEMNQFIENLQHQINDMIEVKKELENNNSNLTNRVAHLEYEKNELKDKVHTMQSSSNELRRKLDLLNELLEERANELNFIQANFNHLRIVNEKLYDQCEELQFSNYDLSIRVQEIQEMPPSSSNLEKELQEFKEKWAASQCDLHDTRQKCKEIEEEHEKTMDLLQSTLQKFGDMKEKVEMYETLMATKSSMNKNEASKDVEILTLKRELENIKIKLQNVATDELQDKNREIERLTQLLNSLRSEQRHSIASEPPRFSLDYLYDSFNDLKFQQAIEIKKQSQHKIDQLIVELASMTTSQKQQQQIHDLKQQMRIVVEKQEITDSALNKCSELCAYTLDHLQEFAQFLSMLLQNKQFRESLSEANINNIKNILEKSMSRQSFGDISNMSAIEVLANAARQSISNICELKASIEQPNKASIDNKEYTSIVNDYEELKRVNELLEDEICALKNTTKMYEKRMSEQKVDIAELKTTNEEVLRKLQEFQNKFDTQSKEFNELMQNHNEMKEDNEKKSQMLRDHMENLTKTSENLLEIESANHQLIEQLEESQNIITSLEVSKTKYESMWRKSEAISMKLEKRLKEIEIDLQTNWITKEAHEVKMREEMINAEAQVAAIRMEMQNIKQECNHIKEMSCSNKDEDDIKENVRRTLEISEDRKKLLMESTGEASCASSCNDCSKQKAEIINLKKHLEKAVSMLKKQAEMKAKTDRSIQQQLSKTENVIVKVRSNMESILKERNSQN